MELGGYYDSSLRRAAPVSAGLKNPVHYLRSLLEGYPLPSHS